jgi:protein gp37
MAEEWAIEIRDQCQATKVAFFFKQWGGTRPKSGGRLLRKREWNDYPRIAKHKPGISRQTGINLHALQASD